MAFPLFATSVWLTWVLGSQLGNDAVARLLFGCVLIAVAAWLYGRLQARRFAFAVIAALLVGGFGVTMAWPGSDTANSTTAKSADAEWIPFSPAKIAELRSQGKGVFVDFTATWCITCQVNKRSSLNQAEVIKKFQTLNVVRMQADWTRKDAVITEALASFGRNGVPLYVFYPPKGEAVILPEVLTPAIVLEAVEKSLATGKSAN
jgi:thiol:disulfide interchange protein